MELTQMNSHPSKIKKTWFPLIMIICLTQMKIKKIASNLTKFLNNQTNKSLIQAPVPVRALLIPMILDPLMIRILMIHNPTMIKIL